MTSIKSLSASNMELGKVDFGCESKYLFFFFSYLLLLFFFLTKTNKLMLRKYFNFHENGSKCRLLNCSKWSRIRKIKHVLETNIVVQIEPLCLVTHPKFKKTVWKTRLNSKATKSQPNPTFV